ncbi:serine/threonine-protein phosphatase 5-like [Paramacrobiotus metropolitanus]|uniref:serine/threonine-protein phosphatase 5-like n=1 Tax=Paramacrobiotus metropolitanus TaxID=2943436 RepID=UPI002445F722|nr:serine/threonine-protein phosphatase 5-like [Paramacrobiotus metropolitanus]
MESANVVDHQHGQKLAVASDPSLAEVSEENRLKAEQLKDEGNELFKQGHYEQAVELYSQAIDWNPSVAAYYANRSFAYLRFELFGSALEDASKAVKLDPKYLKGYYRRAAAQMALGRLKQALKDFETVAKRVPGDKDAALKLSECQKLLRQRQFEWAIRCEEKNSSAFDGLEPDGIVVEESYTGPQLLNGQVTAAFMEELRACFQQQKSLHRKFVVQILTQIRQIFLRAPSMVDVTVPDKCKFTICGDIHGQYYDLCNIFKLNGEPSEENPYLFNGDFVDRGSFSMECIMTLFGYKLLYPDHFFLARGNHETDNMNSIYGFRGEVKAKYNEQAYQLFTEVFNLLPLSHLINRKVLVMHGGLFSQPDVTLEDIRSIERNRQPPDSGLMCEILWSDPQQQLGLRPSKRGVAFEFGPDVTENFCKTNDVAYVVRSHEVKPEGYEVAHGGRCITVFSAPNYCDTIGNLGALINIRGDDLTPKFVTFAAVPHPNVAAMSYASSMFRMLGG